jgi:hypothetical protein
MDGDTAGVDLWLPRLGALISGIGFAFGILVGLGDWDMYLGDTDQGDDLTRAMRN